MSFVVDGKYRVEKRIGRGAFGDIFLGVNEDDGQQVAVKIERQEVRHSQLLSEGKILMRLKGAPGIPKVFFCGRREDRCVMVMELLGPSLEHILTVNKPALSVKSTMMVGDQMLLRIQHIHAHGLLHRDIKPDNFLMGTGPTSSLLFVVDFGLAKEFWNQQTHAHIPFKQGKRLTGTVRYTSLNTHLGYEQSRRDDIEGAGYVLVYLLKGSLPWQGMQAKNRSEKYRLIMQKKTEINIEDLCAGLPRQLVEYFKYAKSLKFEEKPDYAYLRKLLKTVLLQEGHIYDLDFDWTIVPSHCDSLAKRENPAAKVETHNSSCCAF